MLSLSKKGTVPVLLTPDNAIIDQSLDVMFWALNQYDIDDWLNEDSSLSQELVERNDNEFKYYLDRYKYHVAYPEYSQEYYRDKGSDYLALLEKCLDDNKGVALAGDHLSFSDISVFPFIRQFANVDLVWFESSPYQLLNCWYNKIEQGSLFKDCMKKYKQWTPEQAPVYFPQ
ncbi:MAG: glutathione S-transferase [marine bacterium B5-7]|nr:MAG: glutathione S-transferase [marine bacterium B5-7]